MTWEAAMRWARLRATDDGQRRRVFGYRDPLGRWCYAIGLGHRAYVKING